MARRQTKAGQSGKHSTARLNSNTKKRLWMMKAELGGSNESILENAVNLLYDCLIASSDPSVPRAEQTAICAACESRLYVHGDGSTKILQESVPATEQYDFSRDFQTLKGLNTTEGIEIIKALDSMMRATDRGSKAIFAAIETAIAKWRETENDPTSTISSGASRQSATETTSDSPGTKDAPTRDLRRSG